MKHRVLLEFSADTLPDDFLDQIAGRVYGHPAVDKKECTASFVGDVLKDAERLDWLDQNIFSRENIDWITGNVSKTHNMWVTFSPVGAQGSARKILDAAIDAAKDTQ